MRHQSNRRVFSRNFEPARDKDGIPTDYKYYWRTRDGWEIKEHYMDRMGWLTVVGDRHNSVFPGQDWFIAKSYDPATGRWNSQGTYNLTSKEAHQIIGEKIRDGELIPFQVNDPKFVEFEYDGYWNYNQVDAQYLRQTNILDPEFDTYEHSYYHMLGPEAFAEYGGTSPPSRENYEVVRRNHRKANRPTRMYNRRPARGRR